jgi:hypothetical protein
MIKEGAVMKICGNNYKCELYADNRCCCECKEYKSKKDIPCFCSNLNKNPRGTFCKDDAMKDE